MSHNRFAYDASQTFGVVNFSTITVVNFSIDKSRSRAKGNFREGSDIDLTFEGDALDLPLLLKIENELDDLLLPYQLDLSLRAHIDDPDLIAHIARVGQVFYGTERGRAGF